MGFMDRIKNYVNVSEEEYYDNLESDVFQEANEPEATETAEEPRRASRRTRDNKAAGNVVEFVNPVAVSNVRFFSPKNFEEAKECADLLKQSSLVVLKVDTVDRELARRLVDFMTGAVYSNRGTIRHIAPNTFMLVPNSVNVEGSFNEEGDNANGGANY